MIASRTLDDCKPLHLVGAGGSSWWSGAWSSHPREALRCKEETAPQCPHRALPAHGDVDSGQAQQHCLRGLGLTRFGSGLREQGSAQGEVASAHPIAEQSVVAQPGEAAREHVQEESADELAGVEAHHLELVCAGVVAPAQTHLLAVEVDEAVVGCVDEAVS